MAEAVSNIIANPNLVDLDNPLEILMRWILSYCWVVQLNPKMCKIPIKEKVAIPRQIQAESQWKWTSDGQG